ncbi:hypothetical protein MEG1DRAFT_00890 [Photorhabdus temperata subsp. temperata Meg1]|uniref:Uncharacterized protein n=1 Tax=Photorhabdus temperata subsp. temperata Meg1 TaxID=1393735 RepID=A0A081S092_PHOTE|nr:hypothetical protein MEG1DRAFT_00890 [Photorhabdus temperata subsp. temperata Meg1]
MMMVELNADHNGFSSILTISVIYHLLPVALIGEPTVIKFFACYSTYTIWQAKSNQFF